MKRKPNKDKGIFTKGMTWRIIYQGIMIGLITLSAFIIGLGANEDIVAKLQEQYPNLSYQEIKVEIGQTMAFTVIAFAELVHVFNIRNNKESIFKTGIGGNKILFLGIGVAAILMLAVLFIPSLQNIFGIIRLPKELALECIGLIFTPIVIVELMKLLKLNTSKNE